MDPRARLLAALTVAWTAVWVQRAALGPVGPLVQAELGIGYGALGLLPALGLVAGAAGYLLAGRWAQRRPRACLLAGAGLVALGTLLPVLPGGYALLAAGQSVAGFGEALFFVPALALVAAAWPVGAGRAIGTLDSGVSVGSLAALAAAVPLAVLLGGWRGMFLAAGLGGIMAAALLLRAVPRAPPPPPAPSAAAVLARRMWPLYLAATALLLVFFALLFLAPAFLVARGATLPDADHLMALAVALGIPWHLAGGWLADRRGPAAGAAGLALLGALALVGFALAPGFLLAGAMLVVANSLLIGATVALVATVPRVLGADLAAPGFGVFWGLGYLGAAAGPSLAGAAADALGPPAALLLLAGAAAVAAMALAPEARREWAGARRAAPAARAPPG